MLIFYAYDNYTVPLLLLTKAKLHVELLMPLASYLRIHKTCLFQEFLASGKTTWDMRTQQVACNMRMEVSLSRVLDATMSTANCTFK